MLRAAGGLICGVAFAGILLATLAMDGSLHYPLAYPQALLAAIALLFLVSAGHDWHAARLQDDRVVMAPGEAPGGVAAMLATIVLCLAYAVAWPIIGFFPATFVYVAAQLWLLRQRRWYYVLGVPTAVTVLVYIVFDRLLTLPFPPGLLFTDG